MILPKTIPPGFRILSEKLLSDPDPRKEYESCIYSAKKRSRRKNASFYTQYVQELHVCQLSSFERFTGLIYTRDQGTSTAVRTLFLFRGLKRN